MHSEWTLGPGSAWLQVRVPDIDDKPAYALVRVSDISAFEPGTEVSSASVHLRSGTEIVLHDEMTLADFSTAMGLGRAEGDDDA